MVHDKESSHVGVSHRMALGAKVMDESGSQGSMRGGWWEPKSTQRDREVTQHWTLAQELKIARD